MNIEPAGRAGQRLFVCLIWIAAVAVLLLAGGGDKKTGALDGSVWRTGATISSVADIGTAVSFGGPMMLIKRQQR